MSLPAGGSAEHPRGRRPAAVDNGPMSKAPLAGRAAPPSAPGPDGRVARALDWIVPRENPRGVIYGIIVIGAVLAAEGGLRETYAETAGSALIASCTYWLADAYASVLGERLETHAPLTLSGLSRELVRNWAIVRGATIPLLVLLVGWTVGASQATAHEIALWSVVANLVAFELIAGIRARATPIQLALEVGVGVTLALGVLALKLVLHT
jgi:hypothetical protein